MPDLSFLSSFASHPLTLSILTIGAIIIIIIWKIAPHMATLLKTVQDSDTDLKKMLNTVIDSDAKQAQQIEDLQLNLRNNVLDVLRITIYAEHIAIEDRLVAARRYFLKGGNGKVATYVKELVKDHPLEWKAIYAMSKEEERKVLYQIIGD